MNRFHFIVLFLMLAAVSAATAWAEEAATPTVAAEIVYVEPFTYVALENYGPYTAFPVREKMFLDEVDRQGVNALDVEFALYWNSPVYVKPDQLKWDIAFRVAPSTKIKRPLVVKGLKYPRCASALHTGSYWTTYQTVNALYAWIGANGHKTCGGPCMEKYLDPEPDKVADAKKRTQILIPLK